MNMPKPDDWLDTLLEDEPYVEDEGFTEGVVARLPQVRGAPRFVLLVATLLAGVVYVAFDGGQTVSLLAQLGNAVVAGEGPMAFDVRPNATTFMALAALATLAWLPWTIAFDE